MKNSIMQASPNVCLTLSGEASFMYKDTSPSGSNFFNLFKWVNLYEHLHALLPVISTVQPSLIIIDVNLIDK